MTAESIPEIPTSNRRRGLLRRPTSISSGTSSTRIRASSARCASRSRAASQAFGLQNRIGRIMIPTEPVTEIVNGKKRTIERVFLPGYVLVEMDLDNDLWHVIKNTPRVTGFLGTGDKPVALSEEEVSSILFRAETSKDKPRLKIKFEKGE